MKKIISLLMAFSMLTASVSAAPSFGTNTGTNTATADTSAVTDAPDYFYDFEKNYDGWTFTKDKGFTHSNGMIQSHPLYGTYAYSSFEQWENFDLEFDFTIASAESSSWSAVVIRDTNYMIKIGGAMQYDSKATGVQNGVQLPESIKVGETYTMRIEAGSEKGSVYIKKAGANFFQKAGSMPISAKSGRIGFIGMSHHFCVDNVKIWDRSERPFGFDKIQYSLTFGEPIKLPFTNNSGEKVTFTSDTPDIVSIDESGTVTPIKAGNGIIRATGESGYSVTAAVKVNKLITGVSLPTLERNLYLGESINFKANINPADATVKYLKWSVDNENVLRLVGETYNYRGIEAVGVGNARLTVETDDGSAKAFCDFTVTERPAIETDETVFAMKGISHEIAEHKFGVSYMAFWNAYWTKQTKETFEGISKANTDIAKDIGFKHIMNGFSAYDFKQGVHVSVTNPSENFQRFYLEDAVNALDQGAPFIVWAISAANRPAGSDPLATEHIDYAVEMIKEIKRIQPDKELYILCGAESYSMSYQENLPTVEDYITFYKAVSERVKAEVDPEAKFAITLIPPRMYRAIISDPNNWLRSEEDWEYTQGSRATEWHQAIAKDQSWFDAIDAHPYLSSATDVNVTADEWMQELRRTADYNMKTGINEVARLFPGKEIWFSEWSDYQLQFSYSASVDKGRAQTQKTVGSTLAVMQTLGEQLNRERVKISTFHTALDGQGFGIKQGGAESQTTLPYYYAFKKAADLVGVNGRSTHAYPLGLIDGKTIEDEITLNQDSEKLNTQEVYAYGFGDESGMKDAYFVNTTYKNMKVKISDATLKKDWEFKPKEADKPFVDFYIRELDWKEFDPETIAPPTVYEGGEFSEYIELPPYSIVFASVESNANFVDVPDKAKGTLVLKTTSNKAIMPDGYLRNIDTENAEVKPIIVDERTLVPLRLAAECFDAYTIWNSEDSSIGVEAPAYRIDMKIGSNELTRDIVLFQEGDEETLTIDVAPQILGGRTMVPLRAMSEAMENKVFWDAETGIIVISESDIDLSRAELDTLSGLLN